MKKILITGISRGLGKILADYLIQHNCKVYGTVRQLEKFQSTEKIQYFHLDLQDNGSIDKAVHKITKNAPFLDAIIHNSGIAYLAPADAMNDQERRQTFDVNFFGPIHLTDRLLPLLKKASNGKIIFISSIVSLDHWPSLGVYSASKAALECVAFEWAVLLKKWNIDVSVIRPNPLPTDMNILKPADSRLNLHGEAFCNDLEWESPEEICKHIIHILNSSSHKFAYASGSKSEKTANSILKREIYEKLIQKYRKKLRINGKCKSD